MAWAIMCCGCMKVMDRSGKAALVFAPGGNIDLAIPNPLADAADYPTKEVADKAAGEHGWVVVDGDHRCPECYMKAQAEPDPPRRGAYIEIPDCAETPVRHETKTTEANQ